MEAYVTRKEFENAINELRKLQFFLSDVFGNKFTEFIPKEGQGEDAYASEVKKNSTKTSYENLRPSGCQDKNDGFAENDENPSVPIPNLECMVVEVGPVKVEVVDHTPPIPVINGPVPGSKSKSTSHSDNLAELSSTTAHSSSPTQKSASAHANEKDTSQKRIKVKIFSGLSAEKGNKPKPSESKKVPGNMPSTSSTPSTSLVLHNQKCFRVPVPVRRIPKTPVNQSSKACSNDLQMTDISNSEKCPNKKSRLEQRFPSSEKVAMSNPKSSTNNQSSSPRTSQSDIIQCSQCQLFIYSSQLASHMENHTVLDPKTVNMSIEETSFIFERVQKCPLCKVKYKDFQCYEKHCLEHHRKDMPCPVCGKMFQLTSRLRRHMLIHKNLKFTCDICGKFYNRKDNLAAHLKTHEDKEASCFFCTMCKGVAFSSRAGRDRHISTFHPNQNNQVSVNSASPPVEVSKTPASTETIECGNGTESLLEYMYEGDDDESVVIELE